MRTSEEVLAFEHALASLAEDPRTEQLRPLHLVLDDRCSHKEVMFGLVHYLESYALADQIAALVDVLPDLARRAPEWTRVLHYRIINDAAAPACYKAALRAAEPDQRGAGERVLEAIASTEPAPLGAVAWETL